jgi:hypothetical protein
MSLWRSFQACWNKLRSQRQAYRNLFGLSPNRIVEYGNSETYRARKKIRRLTNKLQQQLCLYRPMPKLLGKRFIDALIRNTNQRSLLDQHFADFRRVQSRRA